MKHFTKLLAVILCMVIALSTAACSMSPQWSYKTEGEDNELAIGVYIYAMYNAYSQAQSYAQQTDAYDSETGKYNGEDSFLNLEITDDDGNKAVAEQWILDEADKTMKTLLAIDAEFERVGATIDEVSAKASAKETWELGPYAMYGEQYINPLKDVFEPYGVSYESFEYFYLTTSKEQAIFDKLYNEGGEKAVSDKELTEYFTKNYTSYTYFNTNLYTSEEVSDSDNGTMSKNKAMSKEEIAKNENIYKGYVNDINQGKSIDDVKKAHKADYKLDSDNAVSSVEILKDSSIGEDLVKAIEALKEGQASYKIIGEKDSQSIYFFYKEPIKNQVKNYIDNDQNKQSVLQSMKGEEFKDYMKKLADSTKVEKNDAINDYKPSMFEEK